MIKTVAQILKSKGNEVYTISPDAFIYEALQLMAEKGVGGLVVMSDKQVVGIFPGLLYLTTNNCR